MTVADRDQKQPGGGRRKKPHKHTGRKAADSAIMSFLLIGSTQEQAARNANVSPATVKRRLADPEFQRRLSEAREGMLERITDRAATYALSALDKLHQLQESNNESVALGACKALIEALLPLKGAKEFVERLAALERGRDGSAAPLGYVGRN